ncbi:MAG: enoyl-CoA hydratase/isomerase family protein [Deltaproteobacteria bacterium]|nr:enoyl-CoA hydratase/isomerase family protein [Deltaproteobacteria bacterium]
MIDHLDSYEETSPVTVQWLRDMVVFRFANRPLFLATDLALRDSLLTALDRCGHRDEIRVVVLVGFPEKTERCEYEDFYRATLGKADRLAVGRMLNVFNQLILTIVGLSKPVIFVDGGRIISQFLNVGLACDYRIVSESTVIEKAYLRHSMLPKGGGAWLLGKLLGRSKAYRLLLAEEDVTAVEALRLGLVDEVVPDERLHEAGLAAARRFGALPPATVAGVKQLLGVEMRELSDFLERESQEVLMAAMKSDLATTGKHRR